DVRLPTYGKPSSLYARRVLLRSSRGDNRAGRAARSREGLRRSVSASHIADPMGSEVAGPLNLTAGIRSARTDDYGVDDRQHFEATSIPPVSKTSNLSSCRSTSFATRRKAGPRGSGASGSSNS